MSVGWGVGNVGEALSSRLNRRPGRGQRQRSALAVALRTVKIDRLDGWLTAVVVQPRLATVRIVMLMRVVADVRGIGPGFVFAIARNRRPAELERQQHKQQDG